MNETTYEERPFIKIPEDIMFSDSLNAYEKSILMALIYICDEEDNNTCYPTIKEISIKAKCSESSVHRYLRTLKTKGFLKIKSNFNDDGAQKPNSYTLNFL